VPLPNLLVIGAAKAGTNTLWGALRSHPDVRVADRKELHFFDRAASWHRGAGWYADQFPSGGLVRVDATPAYARFPQVRDVPARAAEVVPGARLVYLLRDPVERIRSHYLHERSHGNEPLPFARAVTEHATYLDTSRYAMQLEQWRAYYDPDRLLVLYSEDLRRDAAGTVARLAAFAGLDPAVPLDLTDRNVTATRTARRPAARRLATSGLGRALPGSARRAARAVTATRVDETGAVLTDDLRAVLTAALRSDLLRLDALLADGHDRWGLLTPTTPPRPAAPATPATPATPAAPRQADPPLSRWLPVSTDVGTHR
jgi:hypothetical protein